MITEADRGHAGSGCRSTPGVGREQPDDSGSYPLSGATAATSVRDLVITSAGSTRTADDAALSQALAARPGRNVTLSITPAARSPPWSRSGPGEMPGS